MGPPVRQLSLWDDNRERLAKLKATLDSLKERFGDPTVRRGSDLMAEQRDSPRAWLWRSMAMVPPDLAPNVTERIRDQPVFR